MDRFIENLSVWNVAMTDQEPPTQTLHSTRSRHGHKGYEEFVGSGTPSWGSKR